MWTRPAGWLVAVGLWCSACAGSRPLSERPLAREDSPAPTSGPPAVASPAPPAPPAPPLVAAPTSAEPPPEAAPAASSSADAGAGSPAPPAPTFSAERPFKLFERPRAQGEVYAAGQDEQLARWNVGGNSDPGYVSSRPHYHPGARVVVDTTILMGNLPKRAPRSGGRRVLSQHQVLAQSRKYGYWPFRLCFENGLRRDQHLKGQTVIRFTMAASGSVRASRLVRTKLEDAEVATCLTDRVRNLSFKPAPGRRVDVELSVKLWPGDAPVPLIGPPDDEDFDNPGELDTRAVTAELEARSPDLLACYREGLARDAGLWGRIQFRIDQAESGRIDRVAQNESRFPDRDVVRCMVRVLRGAELPKPAGGPLSFVYAVRLGEMPPNP